MHCYATTQSKPTNLVFRTQTDWLLCLERRSTTTKTTFYPLILGNTVIKFIETSFHTKTWIERGYNNPLIIMVTYFYIWQVSKALKKHAWNVTLNLKRNIKIWKSQHRARSDFPKETRNAFYIDWDWSIDHTTHLAKITTTLLFLLNWLHYCKTTIEISTCFGAEWHMWKPMSQHVCIICLLSTKQGCCYVHTFLSYMKCVFDDVCNI